MNAYISRITFLALPNKYTRWYIAIIQKALNRYRYDHTMTITANRSLIKDRIGYVEKHHILPESFGLGGGRDPNNYVFLTAREHYIAHTLLPKMFIPGSVFDQKMVFAYFSMRGNNEIKHGKQRYVPSRVFKGARERRAALPGNMTGMTHSDEAKAKMSAAKIGRPSPRKGATLSPESRAKLSEINKGKKRTADSVEKTRQACIKKVFAKGVMYDTVKDACEALGIHNKRLRVWVDQGRAVLEDRVYIVHDTAFEDRRIIKRNNDYAKTT